MAGFSVLIIGGASFDSEIKDLFESHNIYTEHYDARKSQSLKKQNISKNTIGVIITLDRSHMAFGNSNELTRHLQLNKIPFVFSSGNLATFNSAKLLLQMLHKSFPEKVKRKEYVPENVQKLDFYKQEWAKNNNLFTKKLDQWFVMESEWDTQFNKWSNILDSWKMNLMEWKNIQTEIEYKELKKKLNKESAYLAQWKSEIHEFGLKIERNINFVKQWKLNLEELTLEILEEHENIKNQIDKIKDLNDKQTKNNFKNWKVEFENWKQEIELWEKQYLEWLSIYPQAYLKIFEWESAINTWFTSFKKKIDS